MSGGETMGTCVLFFPIYLNGTLVISVAQLLLALISCHWHFIQSEGTSHDSS